MTPTADGYVYNTPGRMVQATSSVGTTTYQVNALAQRVRKTNSSGDTIFHYDMRGRLVAESHATGAPKRDFIDLGDTPVSVAAVEAGPAEIILDNGSPQFSATGAWPTSTSVAGYIGTNYQTHAPNGSPPDAVVVDNTDAGFSTTGTWTPSTAVSGYLGSNYQHHFANGEPPSAIVADNSSGTPSGTWPNSTSVSGYYGTNYQTHAAGTGSESFAWTLNVATAGTYEVYARWTAHPNRASNAKYTVSHSGGQDTVSVSQQTGSAAWQLLGTYAFDAGAATISLSDEANGYVIADAVMLAPPGAAPSTATWRYGDHRDLPSIASGRWTQHPNRATNAKYTVNHSGGATVVTVNQMAGGGTWSLLGAFALDAGQTTVSVTDQADGYVIADSVMIAPPGAAPNSATWTPNVAQAGQYEVYARWTANANRASDATYTVTHASGQTAVSVNQQANGGAWNLLGTFNLNSGTAHNITLTDQANGYVIADAIRLVPVAVQAQQKLYFIEVDHLDTPRLVADAAGTTVWKWDQQEPFGDNVPDENPSGLGVLDLPLRLPGQYADKETNLAYNYFRSYDPSLGRYGTSDPIGFRGGINPYAYAGGDPISHRDPFGLEIVVTGDPADYDSAVAYLQKDSGLAQIVKDLNDSSTVYNIVYINNGNDRYDWLTHTIFWDPHSALRTACDGKQTPALGLGHEMAHANASLWDRLIGWIPWPSYDTLEERRVITGPETTAAQTLGEGVRTDHGGTTYVVPTPISR